MVVIVRLSIQGLLCDAFDGRQVLTNFTRLHGVKPDIYAEGTHFNVRMDGIWCENELNIAL